MAWGASKSIDGLLKRLTDNDQDLTSIHIFQGKKFGSQVGRREISPRALVDADYTPASMCQFDIQGTCP